MDELTTFLSQFPDDNQGSKTWIEETKNSIGGSTIAVLTGKGYDTVSDFINKRLFGDKFSNVAMNFGSLMEDVFRVYLEKYLNTTVYVKGAIPWIKVDGKMHAHYSMDGVLRANFNCFKGSNGEDIFEDEVKTALLEIKFPWSRQLKSYKSDRVGRIGECCVPRSYIEQVKFGLKVVTVADFGFFTDCLARICKLNQFNKKKLLAYNTDLHVNEKNKIDHVLSYGVVKIYSSNFEETNTFKEIVKTIKSNFSEVSERFKIFKKLIPKNLSTKPLLKKFIQLMKFKNIDELKPFIKTFSKRTTSIIDFGENFKNICKDIKDDVFEETNYYRLDYQVELYNNSIELKFDKNEKDLVGVIPWKLFDIYFAKINRDDSFLDDQIEKITKLSNIFYMCQDKTEDEKINLINNFKL